MRFFLNRNGEETGLPTLRHVGHLILGVLIILILSCGLEEEKSSGGGASAGTPPASPTGVTAAAGNEQVVVQWKEAAGALSYNLYWSNAPGVSPTMGTKMANALSPCMHTGLSSGLTYYYVVTAVNAYGESGKSAEVAVTLDGSPPAPTGLSLTTRDRQVILSWDRVERAASYNLYWSLDPGVRIDGGRRIENVTSPYSHTGLTNGSPYYYAVTAVNADGESSLSQEVRGIP